MNAARYIAVILSVVIVESRAKASRCLVFMAMSELALCARLFFHAGM
jgi:hypothetical protein